MDLNVQKTNIRAWKINDTTLKIDKIIVSTFFILDKDSKTWFFKKSFLLRDISLDVVFEILFLTMNKFNINFQTQNLQKRSYITKKVFSITKKVEQIKKENLQQ